MVVPITLPFLFDTGKVISGHLRSTTSTCGQLAIRFSDDSEFIKITFLIEKRQCPVRERIRICPWFEMTLNAPELAT